MGSAASSVKKVLLRKEQRSLSNANNGSGSVNHALQKMSPKAGSFRRESLDADCVRVDYYFVNYHV